MEITGLSGRNKYEKNLILSHFAIVSKYEVLSNIFNCQINFCRNMLKNIMFFKIIIFETCKFLKVKIL
jgi:hypothetical protein